MNKKELNELLCKLFDQEDEIIAKHDEILDKINDVQEKLCAIQRYELVESQIKLKNKKDNLEL